MDRELDLSHADNEVWLIKVPKYIAQKWDNAPCNMDLGTLRIKPSMGQKNHVSLSLTQPLLDMDPQVEIPREHILDVSVVTKQTLGVFSAATNSDVKEATESADVENEKLYMEGRITQKLECRPSANNCYMKLKLESIRKASEPSRKVQSLDKVVQNFKPIKDHAHNIEYRERKKAEGKKSRGDRNSVLDMIFNAFEKHQYYNIKDLVKLTNQPISYLKEILKDICDYNMKNPHKNMWELKKEYRHYQTDQAEEVHDSGSSNMSSE